MFKNVTSKSQSFCLGISPEHHLSKNSSAHHLLKLKTDFASCLYATGVSRQNMNTGRSQSTSATGNLQSYELSYLNWDTELEARREVLIFHTRVLRSPDILTCSSLASFSLPSFLLYYLEKKKCAFYDIHGSIVMKTGN